MMNKEYSVVAIIILKKINDYNALRLALQSIIYEKYY